MASDRSLIQSANLMVNIRETINLGGKARGSSATRQIPGIKSIYNFVVPLVSTRTTALYGTHASELSGSQFDEDLVEYVRITNKDAYYGCDLIIVNGASSTGDEVGIELAAGQSLVLWKHDSVIDATTAGANVVLTATSVVAASSLAIADGDLANGMTEGQYLTLISTDGTTRNYVLSDTNDSGVATGTILQSDSDLGDLNFSAVTAISSGIAVGYDKSAANQYTVLAELQTAIEHANGHNGKILCTGLDPSGAADGVQSFVITQAHNGAGGNTVTTTDITNLTSADFTSGVTAGLTGKDSILSVSGIANQADIDIEIFIASK